MAGKNIVRSLATAMLLSMWGHSAVGGDEAMVHLDTKS